MKVYDDLHQAYLGTLADVYDHPEYVCSPRGQQIREKIDYQFKILKPIAETIVTKDDKRNKVIESYTKKETELYNSCTNKAKDFAQASKFWEQIANADGTINSAYGHLIWKKKSMGDAIQELSYVDNSGMMPIVLIPNSLSASGAIKHQACKRTPWNWAKESLMADKHTRQAFVKFSLPEHQWMGNKDQTCTMHANFLIREDRLNLSVVMRSNDLTLGLVYDMPWFISLINRMVNELKPTYPTLKGGYYTHMVHSIHIYDRDEEKILRMLGRNAT